MKLYFGGGEIPSHRKVLRETEAPFVALSFVGLTRRIKNTTAWLLENKFPEDTRILLDSGAFTVNNAGEKFSIRDLKDLSERYQEFVAVNRHRVDIVTEFDALPLGRDWIEEQRSEFYDDLEGHQFAPIWHPEWGIDYLHGLAANYKRIGIPTTDLSGRNLTPILNSLANDGHLLHGVAMTKVDQMSAVKWDSVSSTSWISPQQYGDTIVWTGNELKRYPKKYKDQARKQHRTLFTREGFDAEKIENDDSTELLRLSIWSWQQLVANIEKHQNPERGVTPLHNPHTPAFTEVEGEEVDTHTGELRKTVSTPAVIEKRQTSPLPVLGVTSVQQQVVNPETGESEEISVSQINVRSDSQRKCDTCFLSAKCPAFVPQQSCAYDIPIEIKTRDQFVQMQNSLIEMQAQRVMFMRFAEEAEGGYADPNLSSEMDRLQKMLKTKNDIESEGFSFKIEGKQTGAVGGQPGMLARLFGDKVQEKANELPGGPYDPKDVIEAEWTEVST